MSERIGFLGIFGSLDSQSGLRGGVLVTDDRGIPLEIRVATPVKPWKIQRAVYGRSLALHVISELISKPLLGSLEYSPRLVLANHRYCLDAESRFPVLLILPADEMVVTSDYQTKILDVSNSGDTLVAAQKAGSEGLSLDEEMGCYCE